MMQNAYRTFDEIEPDHRQFYIERGGLVVIMDGLDDLVEKFNSTEAACDAAMAKKKTDIAEATAELARLKSKRAKRQAMQACGVPARFFEVVAAAVHEQPYVPLETVVRRFLDSPDGEAFRGERQAQPHFSAKIHRIREGF